MAVCALFEKKACTGCTKLNRPYKDQLAEKERRVRDVLRDVVDQNSFRPIVASPEPLAYRTSVKLCLHEDREGRRAVGLYRGGTRQVVTIGACPAQIPAVNRFTAKLFDRKIRPPARFYDHLGRVFQRGRLKFMTVRASPTANPSGEGIGIVVAHTGVEPKALVDWLRRSGQSGVSIYETKLTRGDGDRLTGREIRHAGGPEFFAFPLAGRVYDLSPASFFQANHSLSARLIEAAAGFSEAGDLLLDLYGGFGAYALSAAPRFKGIRLVDGNRDAIRSAGRMGAKVPDFKAYAASCEDFLQKELSEGERQRVTDVIANPPRGGLSSRVSRALNRDSFPNLKAVHYVSCNPETLARDLRVLKEQGFGVRSAQPFDMFPQTEHIEVFVDLQRVHS